MITQLTEKAIAVTGLPEVADRFKIFNDEKPYLSYFIGSETGRLYLPEGNWTILGRAAELIEVDWKRVVKFVGLPWNAYKDYTTNKKWYDHAILSGHSLLKANDLDPLLNHLILIQ